ncbi:MAG: hypothetical protein KDJ22_17215, partial [Candidatus Competibacteraceae bacterium]|nr:hypothetical protein [Candidatus Competibacteraceae bacterium]
MNPPRSLRPSEPGTKPGLARQHFRRIAAHGFGDPYNAYPHSMIAYKGYVYVGTTRANLCMLKVSKIPSRFAFWPVECPEDLYDLDMRAQIWRYDPVVEEWREVYRSPWIDSVEGKCIPRDMGYR